jgi:hypothetical protein
MPINWVVFLAAVWIGTSMICLVCEGAWLGPDEETVLSQLQNVDILTEESFVGKMFGVFDPDLWDAILSMATLDYDIFGGQWQIVRMLILLPIVAGVIYMSVYSALRLIRGGG